MSDRSKAWRLCNAGHLLHLLVENVAEPDRRDSKILVYCACLYEAKSRIRGELALAFFRGLLRSCGKVMEWRQVPPLGRHSFATNPQGAD